MIRTQLTHVREVRRALRRVIYGLWSCCIFDLSPHRSQWSFGLIPWRCFLSASRVISPPSCVAVLLHFLSFFLSSAPASIPHRLPFESPCYAWARCAMTSLPVCWTKTWLSLYSINKACLSMLHCCIMTFVMVVVPDQEMTCGSLQ